MSKKKKETEKKGKLNRLIVFCTWLFSIGGIFALALILLIISYTDSPSLEELENPKSNLATEVITSDGVVLGQYFKQNRTNADFYELPSNLVNALIATEDERFYDHAGVDGEALARAVAKMGKGGGGSTLTQQLAKMLFNEPAKDIIERLGQKLGEWIIAIRIERSYTKQEIIAMYFNQYDFLNIDVEGAELEILKGFEDNLNYINMIFLETSLNDRNKTGASHDTIVEWLRERGFKLREMSDSYQQEGWGDSIFLRNDRELEPFNKEKYLLK